MICEVKQFDENLALRFMDSIAKVSSADFLSRSFRFKGHFLHHFIDCENFSGRNFDHIDFSKPFRIQAKENFAGATVLMNGYFIDNKLAAVCFTADNRTEAFWQQYFQKTLEVNMVLPTPQIMKMDPFGNKMMNGKFLLGTNGPNWLIMTGNLSIMARLSQWVEEQLLKTEAVAHRNK